MGGMLRRLEVQNLAVIREAALDFAPGLNVLTGETGAGKSLLVDALALLLGGRAEGLIGPYGESLLVTAFFEGPPGEEEELLALAERLRHLETIRERLARALALLTEREAQDLLALAAKEVRAAARHDPALEALAEELSGAAEAVRAVARELEDHLEGLDLDPEELDRVEARLSLLERLKRKYGPTLADVLAHAQKAREELAAKQAEDIAQRSRDALAWLNAEIAQSREEEQWATSARLRNARERRRVDLILASPPSWNIAVGVAVNGHRGRAVVAVLSMSRGKQPHVCEIEEATTGSAAWHAVDHALSLVVPTGRAVVIHTTFDSLDRANYVPSPWESDEIKRRVNCALRDTKSVVVCTKYDHPTMGQWMHAASRAARSHLDELNATARAEEMTT